MKNRIKNLSPNQIQKIAFLISTIISLILIIIAIIFNVLLDPKVIISILIIWILGIFVIDSILSGYSDYEENEQKKSVNTLLSKKEYTEVTFSPFSNNSNNIGDDRLEMALSIFEVERCRFYAKITEDDTIRLIVKNKYDNKIYDTEIKNYHYFNQNFKKKEN